MRKGTIQPRGEEVVRLRLKKCWTQDELAKQAGYSKRTIENVEADKPTYPQTLANIAQALGPDVQMKDLVATEAEEPNDDSVEAANGSGFERIGNAPPLPSLLIGREEDLTKLASRLGRAASETEQPPTQVITAVRGWPGVGKTSVARAIAHSPELAEAFPDGVLWVSLGPAPSLLAELVVWGRALGDKGALLAKDVAEASHRLAGLLRERRMLIIVDDVWETSHVVPFSIGGRRCAMLVTTRASNVADAVAPTPDDIFRLDVLSEEQSLKLLEALAPTVVVAFRGECLELARAVQGLPLALQVAGRMLRAEQQRGRRIGELLAELRQDIAKLLQAQAPADMGVPGGVSPTVTALLRKSTDCLEPEIRKCFARLAPFAPRPGVCAIEHLRRVWQSDEAATRQIIDVLVDRGLMEVIGRGEFQIHQVLLHHAKMLYEEMR